MSLIMGRSLCVYHNGLLLDPSVIDPWSRDSHHSFSWVCHYESVIMSVIVSLSPRVCYHRLVMGQLLCLLSCVCLRAIIMDLSEVHGYRFVVMGFFSGVHHHIILLSLVSPCGHNLSLLMRLPSQVCRGTVIAGPSFWVNHHESVM